VAKINEPEKGLVFSCVLPPWNCTALVLQLFTVWKIFYNSLQFCQYAFPLWYLQREEKRKKQIKNAFKGSFKVLAIYFVHPRKRKEPFP